MQEKIFVKIMIAQPFAQVRVFEHLRDIDLL